MSCQLVNMLTFMSAYDNRVCQQANGNLRRKLPPKLTHFLKPIQPYRQHICINKQPRPKISKAPNKMCKHMVRQLDDKYARRRASQAAIAQALAAKFVCSLSAASGRYLMTPHMHLFQRLQLKYVQVVIFTYTYLQHSHLSCRDAVANSCTVTYQQSSSQ